MSTNVFQTSASAPDADERISSLELECGIISASQEDLLAGSSFLGGDGGEEEAEVFSTPLTQGQQSQQDQGEEEEDAITMCTLPITQHSPSPSRSSPEDHDKEEDQADSMPRTKEPRKPRICTRKVRGARLRTPTPSPSPERGRDVDPLYKALLMIPSAPLPTPTGADLLALARQRGIF
ncbi:hypothetical protein QOZ80_1BG0064970 [Eleusine coracana subsp. coracana]|nr:hypothetical protein QOZ80_1BG0064970 [Eleusine coracana subsp. coracana]